MPIANKYRPPSAEALEIMRKYTREQVMRAYHTDVTYQGQNTSVVLKNAVDPTYRQATPTVQSLETFPLPDIPTNTTQAILSISDVLKVLEQKEHA